jgi:hypothetical protein
LKFTIWREGDGNFVLKRGDEPIRQGDTCFKLIECKDWTQANAELHRFMDQRAKDMPPSA